VFVERVRNDAHEMDMLGTIVGCGILFEGQKYIGMQSNFEVLDRTYWLISSFVDLSSENPRPQSNKLQIVASTVALFAETIVKAYGW
jgi:hypothetical protein